MQKFDHKLRPVIDKYSTHQKSIAQVLCRCCDQRFQFVFRRKNFHFKLEAEIQTT